MHPTCRPEHIWLLWVLYLDVLWLHAMDEHHDDCDTNRRDPFWDVMDEIRLSESRIEERLKKMVTDVQRSQEEAVEKADKAQQHIQVWCLQMGHTEAKMWWVAENSCKMSGSLDIATTEAPGNRSSYRAFFELQGSPQEHLLCVVVLQHSSWSAFKACFLCEAVYVIVLQGQS